MSDDFETIAIDEARALGEGLLLAAGYSEDHARTITDCVVRAQMDPVFRRTLDGGRKQVKPLVKVSSEARLLSLLAEDLKEFEA